MNMPPTPPELIGQSPVFLDALAHASAAAALDRPLLVAGERGAGKELLAARIHFLSPRWEGPLIKVNCAAMNEDLLESELFGHEAGSFTGAAKRHRGRFERAEGGTLFLDEISSASARVQEKLLRVIEYGEYERIGGEETLNADVRIVAATNIDLRRAAERGDFRPDLLDRLAFDVVTAPPLRARKEDIAPIAAHFAAGIAREMETRFDGFTAHAMQTLIAHDWPGNVRELKNAVERSFYRWRAGDHAGPVDAVIIDPFPPSPALGRTEQARRDAREAPKREETHNARGAPRESLMQQEQMDLRAVLDEFEKQLTADALANNGGNQRKAAKALKLTYDQMRGLVRKHDLAPG